MATRNEFLCRNAQAIRFGNLDLATSAYTLASRLLPNSPLIFIADAHRDDGKRFVVRADEKLTAFLELESSIRGRLRSASAVG
jgi:hypothetical protein